MQLHDKSCRSQQQQQQSYRMPIVCKCFLWMAPYSLNSSPPIATYMSVNWVNIGSESGLSPDRRQAIIWTNTGILLIWPSGTNFSEIRIKIRNFSFMKMHLKMSSGKLRPFCSGGDELSPRWTQWFISCIFMELQAWFKDGLIFLPLFECLAYDQPHYGRNGHQIEGDWEEHRHRWNETNKHPYLNIHTNID